MSASIPTRGKAVRAVLLVPVALAACDVEADSGETKRVDTLLALDEAMYPGRDDRDHGQRDTSHCRWGSDAPLTTPDEPESSAFSRDAHWAPGEQMASMRNGSGDEYSFTITPNGTYGRGFDHESALSPFTRQPPRPYAGLLDVVPGVLRGALDEPAFKQP